MKVLLFQISISRFYLNKYSFMPFIEICYCTFYLFLFRKKANIEQLLYWNIFTSRHFYSYDVVIIVIIEIFYFTLHLHVDVNFLHLAVSQTTYVIISKGIFLIGPTVQKMLVTKIQYYLLEMRPIDLFFTTTLSKSLIPHVYNFFFLIGKFMQQYV